MVKELEQAFVDEVVLGLAGSGGGLGADSPGGEETKKNRSQVVLPTVIIDAAIISPDPDSTGGQSDHKHSHKVISPDSQSNSSHINNSNNNSNSSSSHIHSNSHHLDNNNDSSQSEGMLEEGRVVTVRDLLKGLYEKACQQKLWGLVRHTAGMLGKRVEDLAKAVTDLLVRQKQVTVGMPPNNEHTITAPLPEVELRQLIHDVSLP